MFYTKLNRASDGAVCGCKLPGTAGHWARDPTALSHFDEPLWRFVRLSLEKWDGISRLYDLQKTSKIGSNVKEWSPMDFPLVYQCPKVRIKNSKSCARRTRRWRSRTGSSIRRHGFCVLCAVLGGSLFPEELMVWRILKNGTEQSNDWTTRTWRLKKDKCWSILISYVCIL